MIIDKSSLGKEKSLWHLSVFCKEYYNNVENAKLTLDRFLSQSESEYVETVKTLLSGDTSIALYRQDKSTVDSFAKGLVANNSQVLLAHLSSYDKIFSDRFATVNKSNVASRSVSKKVGLLLGAVVGLLLI